MMGDLKGDEATVEPDYHVHDAKSAVQVCEIPQEARRWTQLSMGFPSRVLVLPLERSRVSTNVR